MLLQRGDILTLERIYIWVLCCRLSRNSCTAVLFCCYCEIHACTHNRIGDRSFAVAGPRLWNSLPIIPRQISSFGQFRRYLKNHLFGIWEITAQCGAWFSALYKYLLTYLLTYILKTYWPTKRVCMISTRRMKISTTTCATVNLSMVKSEAATCSWPVSGSTRRQIQSKVKYTSICRAHFYAKRLKCAQT